VRQATVLFEHLCARLAPDHGVEIAHHHRIRMRAGDRTDDVEGIGDVRYPVAHGFVERVLEGLRSGNDRYHLRAQQLHAVDVDLLPLDIDGAHVDHAIQAKACANGCGRHAVLAGAGFGNDAALAHAPGDQGLADRVVDLVRAGVL